MSDQNQWPKPGESSGGDDGRTQHDGQPDGQQSGTPQPGTQQPDGRQSSPSAQSSHGNPYAQPSQDSPYGQGQQSANPYAQPSQDSPYGQGQQSANPYTQPHQSSGNPYAPQSQQQNPYAPQSQQQNPYAPQSQQGNPYAQQQPGNPYAASGPQHNPYAPQQGSNPYASPYATAGYQPYAQRPKTNTLAILSIVFSGAAGLSLLTFVFAFFAVLAGPAGAILGHLALGKTKTTGESGRGLALAGIIVGWVATGIALIGIIVFFVLIAGSGGGYSDPYDYDSGAFIR